MPFNGNAIALFDKMPNGSAPIPEPPAYLGNSFQRGLPHRAPHATLSPSHASRGDNTNRIRNRRRIIAGEIHAREVMLSG